MDTVSVILPTLNRQETTVRAARSVLWQAGVDLELWIVDDGSTPRFEPTADLAADRRLNVLHLPSNKGPATARNFGVAAAKGNLLSFLDSDDFFLPGKLARQLRLWRDLQTGERPLLVVSGVWTKRRGSDAHFKSTPLPAGELPIFAQGCWYYPGSTALISKAHWETIGLLDERMKRLEDFDWGVRFGLRGGQLSAVPEPLAVINPSSAALPTEVGAAACAIAAKFGAAGPLQLPPRVHRHLRSYLLLERAASRLRQRDYVRMAADLARSWLLYPRTQAQLSELRTIQAGSESELDYLAKIEKSLEKEARNDELWAAG